MRDFIAGYIECAMWLGQHYETEEQTERGEGASLQDVCAPDEIPTDVMAEILEDCESFYDNYAHLWSDEPYYDDSQAGHDFFLTRNHHGAGFWDSGLCAGDELTDAAHVYGSFNLEKWQDQPIHSYS